MRYSSEADAEAAGIPRRIDGARLPLDAMNALADMVAKLRAADRRRDLDECLTLATTAFRKSHEVKDGVWMPRSIIRLGTSDDGPLVPNRYAPVAQRRRELSAEAITAAGRCTEEAAHLEAARLIREQIEEDALPICGRQPTRPDMVLLVSLLRAAAALGTTSARRANTIRAAIERDLEITVG